MKAVESVNNRQKSVLFEKLINRFQGNIVRKTFAIWGLSLKPNTDDIREAPSLVIIENILKIGGKVKAYDPIAIPEANHIIGNKIDYSKNEYEALVNSETLLIVTEWVDFKSPNFDKIKKALINPIIFDGRNIYNSKEINELGFEHYGVGTK